MPKILLAIITTNNGHTSFAKISSLNICSIRSRQPKDFFAYYSFWQDVQNTTAVVSYKLLLLKYNTKPVPITTATTINSNVLRCRSFSCFSATIFFLSLLSLSTSSFLAFSLFATSVGSSFLLEVSSSVICPSCKFCGAQYTSRRASISLPMSFLHSPLSNIRIP